MGYGYLKEKCPVCKEGALEITNYTATDCGNSYYTAKCTNCRVAFDYLDSEQWHEIEEDNHLTEKRFEATAFDCQYVTDHLKHKDYPVVSEFKYANDLCNLLNELNEENEQLKQIIKELEQGD